MSQIQSSEKTETGKAERSHDWDRLQTELKLWGRRLDELRSQSGRVGESAIDELQQRYDLMVKEAQRLKQSTDDEIARARREVEKMTEEVEKQSQSVFEKASENASQGAKAAREMSREVKERTEKTAGRMSESAQQLGTGFSRAWYELYKGFERAYERLS